MKIILLTDISKLGKKFDIKEVNSGHATNLLIPNKMAVAATPNAVKKLESEKARTLGQKKVQEELLVKSLTELSGKTLKMTEKANEKGHLFAGLHKEEIAKELTAQTRIEISPDMINLDHPIKETGEHTIELKSAGKSTKLKLVIEGK